MVNVDDIDPDELSKAVTAWTGYQSAVWPTRDEKSLTDVFSVEEIAKLVPVITALADDFYRSQAHITAASLQEMGDVASEEFRSLYPELPAVIAEAFAWCYTFDYK